MSEEVVFRREGGLFRATECATGPWGADKLHGGPVFGLIARVIEVEMEASGLMLARLTCDLFRAVPHVPLEVRAEVVRRSGRLCLMAVSLLANGEEYVRASALLLRTEAAPQPSAADTPPGPEGLPTESLMRLPRGARLRGPEGYHTRVETRWVPRDEGEPLAIWFRLPMPLVEGELATPLIRAVALSDFANAVASIADRERHASPRPFINVDATLVLVRPPEGEWFCLREAAVRVHGAVSIAEVEYFDVRGPLGRVVQARLENRSRA